MALAQPITLGVAGKAGRQVGAKEKKGIYIKRRGQEERSA